MNAYVQRACLLDIICLAKEFRRHQKTDNQVHIIGFLSQWKVYLDELNVNAGPEFKGKQLDPTVFERVCQNVDPQAVKSKGSITC